MKKLVLFITLMLTYCEARTQDERQNVYYECFKKHVDNYDLKKAQSIFIKESSGIGPYIPDSVSGIKVVQLNDAEINKKVKKGNFILIEIFPIQIESDKILLSIVEYSVVRSGRKKSIVMHGGSEFEISILDGHYVIVNESHRGI